MLCVYCTCNNRHSRSQYPDWLVANKPSLSPEDFQRYEQQSHIMGEICKQFEKEGEGPEEKESTFESIMDLMQKVETMCFIENEAECVDRFVTSDEYCDGSNTDNITKLLTVEGISLQTVLLIEC